MGTDIFKYRIINSLFKKPLDNKVFFMHLPKTGGRSVEEALKNRLRTLAYDEKVKYARYDSIAAASMSNLLYGYDFSKGNSNDYEMQRFGIEYLAYMMNKPMIECISGHICFDERIYQKYHGKYKFITMLRDPVKRFLSMFFYIKYRTVRGEGRKRLDISDSLENYIKSKHALQQGYEYVKHYGGISEDSDYYISDIAVIKAIENLRKFDVVGILEDMESFQKNINNKIGIDLSVGVKNVTPASHQQILSEIHHDLLGEIRSICAQDYRIYNSVNAM
jgi:hypothetical protein